MGKRKAREAKLNDLYEAEEADPDEEKKAGQRYDVVDNYQFELPEDFEDEEIDEEMAFTEEDKKLYAGLLGSSKQRGRRAAQTAEDALLDSAEEEEEEDEPELNRDDFSDEDEEADARYGKPARPSGAVAPAKGSDVDDIFVDVSDVDSDEDADSEGDADATELQRVANTVRETVGRPQRRAKVAEPLDEAMPESEFNLPGASGTGELSVEDLISGLGEDKAKLASARKFLDRLTRRAEVVAPPLPTPIRERKERQAGYEKTSQDVSKWTGIVKANREAPTLHFTNKADNVPKTSTTAALTAKFEVGEGMEAEVAAMLRQAGVHSDQAVQEAEEALALKAVNAEEMQQRREALAKMRSLLFKHEERSRHLAKIKSKAYHRRSNKAARLKAEKAGELGEGDFIRLQAEEAEFKRAKERLTLKHKNTSQWARRALKRGVNLHEDGKKEAIDEQLRLGQELRRRVERTDPVEGSDTDASDDDSSSGSESEGHGQDGGGTGLGRSATAKIKTAALDMLQGAGEGEDATKGLFALPFMRRAQEKRKLAAQEDARALVAELDGLADQDDAEPVQSGRRTFGLTPLAPERDSDSEEDLGSSDEDEVREARRERLRNARFRERAHAGGTAGPSTATPVDGTTRAAKGGRTDRSSRKQRGADALPPEDESAELRDGEWGVSITAMTDGPLSIDDGSAVPLTPQQRNPKALAEGVSGDSDGQPGNLLARVARQQQGRSHLFSAEPPISQGDLTNTALPDFGTGTAPESKGTKSRGSKALEVSVGLQTIRGSQPAAEAEAEPGDFLAAKKFKGSKTVYWFGKGAEGVGYYREAGEGPPATRQKAMVRHGANVKVVREAQEQEADIEMPGGGADEGDEELEDANMQLTNGGQLSQRELIARAFAGDDVAAEFEADKAAETLEELPKIETPSLMPGWGAWAAQQREPRWMAAAKAKAERQKKAAAAGRKDARLKTVTISERWDKKAAKYNAAVLPYPHTSKESFERSMRQPLGPDFNTTTSFRDMTRPAVIKSPGVVIQPIKYSEPVAKQRIKLPAHNAKRKKTAKVGVSGMSLNSRH